METVLNLLWLTLALTALGHWIAKARWDSPEQSKALRLTALVMLLVLLFPVISLTDDLQASAALMETERAGTSLAPNDTHAALQTAQNITVWNAVLERPTAYGVATATQDIPFEPSAAAYPYALGQRPPPPRAISFSLNS